MARWKLMLLNLRLHDGEAPEGSETAANDIPADGGQEEQGADELAFLYEGDAGELDPDAQGDTNDEPVNDQTSKPFKVYQTQEEYQREFDATIGRRLSKQREMEQRLAAQEEVLQDLMKAQKVASIEDLRKKAAEDAAYESGLTPEQYQEQRRQAAEIAHYRRSAQEQAERQFVERLFSEVDALKGTKDKPGAYPEIDMAKLRDNDEFLELVAKGVPVRKAYEATNMDAIIAAKARQAQARTAQDIRARGQRIPEGAASKGTSGARVQTDPSKWTKAQWDAVDRAIARGERITF